MFLQACLNGSRPPGLWMTGYDFTTWAVLDAAVRHDREIRIGFEDTYALPDARRAGSNAELVPAAAKRYLSSSG